MKAVKLSNICKQFGEVKAAQDVSFELEQGEIHALLGENGAGKTTLMNILYGIYSCDSGGIEINGEPVVVDNPRKAIDHGVGMVHQHFMLIPQLTVTQNIFLGMKESGFFLKTQDLNRQVREINERFHFNVQPESFIWQLPVGVQQKVEILKALIRNAKILILDEPTAVLTPREVEELFVSIDKLTEEGYSVILITHKMEEVMQYADRVTVMREGCNVKTLPVAETDLNELARLMVGRSVSLERNMEEAQPGSVVFKAEKLVVQDEWRNEVVKNVSFEIREGEIFGIAGVDGNGQLELGEAVTGLRRLHSGSLFIDGERKHKTNPREMLRSGLAHIPDDRHKKGLILPFSVTENLILGSQRAKEHHKGLILDYEKIEKEASDLVETFDVRPRNTALQAGMLSGGNQQKVILAREISRHPRFLVALQPTRGLDIGAIEFVRKKIVEERNAGKAVLLVSTDMDEILSLSDRIAVMYEGEILDIVSHDTPLEKIGLLMGGVKNAEREEL